MRLCCCAVQDGILLSHVHSMEGTQKSPRTANPVDISERVLIRAQGRVGLFEKLAPFRRSARTVSDMKNPNRLGIDREVDLVNVRIAPVEKLPNSN